MKMKFNHILAGSVFLTVMGMTFSCDYLDVDEYFDDTLKYDSVFSNKRYFEAYLWGAAAQLPDESKIFGHEYAPGITAGDDIFTVMSTDIFRGSAFTLGYVTPDDLRGMNIWSDMYKIIRKANIMLSRMDECQDMTTADRRNYTGYIHFLRGYAYYHILMNCGPAILVGDQVYESNLDGIAYNNYRATYDETVEYICSELETAAAYLPVRSSMAQFERPTRGAAYALIARVRLHAASPLFNGTSVTRKYFGKWQRSYDGANYVNLNYDERKYALAAAACKRVMDMQAYELFTVKKDQSTPDLPGGVPTADFPSGAGGIEYICSELETAAAYLPVRSSMAQFERPTRGAAYALIARVRLHAASPLFNGTSVTRKYFGKWQRSYDGANYVNLNYDERKYALAAAACKRVMDMQAYELFTVKKDQSTPDLPGGVPTADFPSGAGGIDPFKSYSYMFTGDEPFKNNSEVIWGRISGEVSAYTQQSFPEFMGGYNGMGLTQKMIDAYRMDDGRTIEEARADGDYKEGPNDFTDGPRDFSGYHLEGGIWQMYANREMRFYACVGFSGCYWPALSTTQNDVRNQVVEYCLDGNANKYASNTTAENYTPTGYVIKKYISSYDAWKGDGNERYEKGFPIIRYAEILLSYAEALNELTASHSVTLPSGETYMLSHDVNEIASAFNQVRYRAGLPGLKAAELNDRDELFEQIKRERMVEFLGEGRRFYDVRRWGIYEDEDSEPIMGLNIEANKNGGFYQRTVVNERNYRDRVVDKRLLFLPISKSELRKVPLLDQNPGYSD